MSVGYITCRASLQNSYTQQVFLGFTLNYLRLASGVKVFPQDTTVFQGPVLNSVFEDVDVVGCQIPLIVKTATKDYENLPYVLTSSTKVYSSREFFHKFVLLAIAQGDINFHYGDSFQCYVVLPDASSTILYFNLIIAISGAVPTSTPMDFYLNERLKREFTSRHYDLINQIYDRSAIQGYANTYGVPMDDVETIKTGDINYTYAQLYEMLQKQPYDEFLNPNGGNKYQLRKKDRTIENHVEYLNYHGNNQAIPRPSKKRYKPLSATAYARYILGKSYRTIWPGRMEKPYGEIVIKPSEGLTAFITDTAMIPLATANAMAETFARYGLVALDKILGYENSDAINSSDIFTDYSNFMSAGNMITAGYMTPGPTVFKVLAGIISAVSTKFWLQVDKDLVGQSVRYGLNYFKNNKEGYGKPGDYPYIDSVIDGLLGDSTTGTVVTGMITSLFTGMIMKQLVGNMSWPQMIRYGLAKFNSQYQASRELMYGPGQMGMLGYVDDMIESAYNLRPDVGRMREGAKIFALQGKEKLLELGYQGKEKLLELGYEGMQDVKDASIYIADQLVGGEGRAVKLYEETGNTMLRLSQSAKNLMSSDPMKFLQGYFVLAENIDRIQSGIEDVFKRKASFRAVEYTEELIKLHDKTKEVSKFFDKAKAAAKNILMRQKMIEDNPNPYTQENRNANIGIVRKQNELKELSQELIEAHTDLMISMEEFRQFRDDGFYENDFADPEEFYDAVDDGLANDYGLQYQVIDSANDRFNQQMLALAPIAGGNAAIAAGRLVGGRFGAPGGLSRVQQMIIGGLGTLLSSYLLDQTRSGKQAQAPYNDPFGNFTDDYSYQYPNITNKYNLIDEYPVVPYTRKRDYKQKIKDLYRENERVLDFVGGTTAAGTLLYAGSKMLQTSDNPRTKELVANTEKIVDSARPAVNTLTWNREARIKRGEHDFRTYSRRFYKLLMEREEEEMKRRKRKNRLAIYY